MVKRMLGKPKLFSADSCAVYAARLDAVRRRGCRRDEPHCSYLYGACAWQV